MRIKGVQYDSQNQFIDNMYASIYDFRVFIK